MATIQKLESGRAEFAYKCAEEGSKIEKKKEYKSYVKKIPMLIKTNGLGATFAFMKAKGGTYQKIYEHTYNWLKSENGNKLGIFTGNEDLIAKIITLNSAEYRALTNEVMAFFAWLKRFAEGLIEGD